MGINGEYKSPKSVHDLIDATVAQARELENCKDFLDLHRRMFTLVADSYSMAITKGMLATSMQAQVSIVLSFFRLLASGHRFKDVDEAVQAIVDDLIEYDAYMGISQQAMRKVNETTMERLEAFAEAIRKEEIITGEL